MVIKDWRVKLCVLGWLSSCKRYVVMIKLLFAEHQTVSLRVCGDYILHNHTNSLGAESVISAADVVMNESFVQFVLIF